VTESWWIDGEGGHLTRMEETRNAWEI